LSVIRAFDPERDQSFGFHQRSVSTGVTAKDQDQGLGQRDVIDPMFQRRDTVASEAEYDVVVAGAAVTPIVAVYPGVLTVMVSLSSTT
jgi:hypothetical protein